MVGRVATLFVLVLLAAGLATLGYWGRRHGLDLVPEMLPDDERQKRAAAVERGALVCYLGAAVMAAVGVLAVL